MFLFRAEFNSARRFCDIVPIYSFYAKSLTVRSLCAIDGRREHPNPPSAHRSLTNPATCPTRSKTVPAIGSFAPMRLRNLVLVRLAPPRATFLPDASSSVNCAPDPISSSIERVTQDCSSARQEIASLSHHRLVLLHIRSFTLILVHNNIVFNGTNIST